MATESDPPEDTMLAELDRLTHFIILTKPPPFTVEACEAQLAEAQDCLAEAVTLTPEGWQERCDAYYTDEVRRTGEISAAHESQYKIYTTMVMFLRKKLIGLAADHPARADVVRMLAWAELILLEHSVVPPSKLTWEAMRSIMIDRATQRLNDCESRLEYARRTWAAYNASQQCAAALLAVYSAE